jgi:hypothetical protein
MAGCEPPRPDTERGWRQIKRQIEGFRVSPATTCLPMMVFARVADDAGDGGFGDGGGDDGGW